MVVSTTADSINSVFERLNLIIIARENVWALLKDIIASPFSDRGWGKPTHAIYIYI